MFKRSLSMLLFSKIKLLVYRCFNIRSPKYPYMVEPSQLALLVNELDKLKDGESSVIEIGTFRGMTTRFLCEHITCQNLNNISYWAIDTFNSFEREDVDFEVIERGKKRSLISSAFKVNDFDIFKKNFKDYPFLTAIKENCTEVNFEAMKPIKLVFLDVDLYLPTLKVLREVFRLLEEDGVIIVDDVMENNTWDGAHQAYMEFCKELNIIPEIIGNKSGIIRKTTY